MNKSLTIMICLFLLVGMNRVSFAQCTTGILDPQGDAIGPVDLFDAQAEIYEIRTGVSGDTEPLLKLTIATDNPPPGVVIFECDVDDSTGTGGSISMLGTPISPCSCKTTAGFDIVITLFIRQQGDDSVSAICSSCSDNQGSCGKGRKRGEWYVTTSASGQPTRHIGVLRGYLDPLPVGSGSGYDCYTFPWSHILWYAYQELQGNPKRFNFQKAMDFVNNNKWQVSVWYDEDFTDEDDITDGLSGPLNVSDWAPNGDGTKADMEAADQLTYCEGNFDGDGDVDGTDASVFKSNFGASGYTCPCPSCGPWY